MRATIANVSTEWTFSSTRTRASLAEHTTHTLVTHPRPQVRFCRVYRSYQLFLTIITFTSANLTPLQMNSLPAEIAFHSTGYLQNPDLLRLALVSKRFYSIARKLSQYTCHDGEDGTGWMVNPRNGVSLNDVPALAHSIEHLNLVWDQEKQDRHPRAVCAAYASLRPQRLLDLIALCPNLRSFHSNSLPHSRVKQLELVEALKKLKNLQVLSLSSPTGSNRLRWESVKRLLGNWTHLFLLDLMIILSSHDQPLLTQTCKIKNLSLSVSGLTDDDNLQNLIPPLLLSVTNEVQLSFDGPVQRSVRKIESM